MARTSLRVEHLEDRVTPVTLPDGFSESLFAVGLTGPTAMSVSPDGRVFVAEQGGTLRVVQNGAVLSTPFISLTVDRTGERGLVGVTLDPNFINNGFVYVFYTVPGSPAHNRVSRFTANGNVAAPNSEFVLLELDPLVANNHNGGALKFGPDGKLYVAVGDNSTPAFSQSLANRHGKILRINPDGTIPADNPASIDGLGAVPAGATRAIWAAGLRNPFTMSFDSVTGDLFINDVGQQAYEEINLGAAGKNYGWPATEGDFDPAAFPDFTRPIYSYGRNDPRPFGGVCILGGAFYRTNSFSFPAEYEGDYFFADLFGRWINVRDSVTGTVSNFADFPTGNFPINLTLGPAGQLLYLSQRPDAIFQITYRSDSPPIAAGAGAGGAPVVKLVDPVSGIARLSVNAFGNFSGGARVATADVTGDTIPDLVAAAGPGGGPDVRVIDGVSGVEARRFFAFEPTFNGGMYVSAGDVDEDGFADLAVSADVGGGPRVVIVSGKDGSTLANFFGIDDMNFRGGARTAFGDISGDGIPDLIVAAGAGGGPRIAVFDGTTLRPGIVPQRLFNDFFAFEPGLRNGTYVAAGDVNGDGSVEIITGAGPGGAPRIVAFAAVDRTPVADFFVGDLNDRRGIPIAARNLDADAQVEIIAGSPAGSAPGVGVYKVLGAGAVQTSSFLAFESTFTGGVFVG